MVARSANGMCVSRSEKGAAHAKLLGRMTEQRGKDERLCRSGFTNIGLSLTG